MSVPWLEAMHNMWISKMHRTKTDWGRGPVYKKVCPWYNLKRIHFNKRKKWLNCHIKRKLSKYSMGTICSLKLFNSYRKVNAQGSIPLFLPWLGQCTVANYSGLCCRYKQRRHLKKFRFKTKPFQYPKKY